MKNQINEPEVLELAQQLSESLASTKLPFPIARLYSQFSRLNAGQPGLVSWKDNESVNRLEESFILLESAEILKANEDQRWQMHYLRAAEIFEWLSHPKLNINNLPLKMYSAALYQLAGYPARASGIIKSIEDTDNISGILCEYFMADFSNTIVDSLKFINLVENNKSQIINKEVLNNNYLAIRECVRCLSLISSYMRWGENDRLDRALQKLKGLQNVYIHSEDIYSWLLAKICSDVSEEYFKSASRQFLSSISELVNESGKNALEKYARYNFRTGKALLWKSQILGIEKLIKEHSFALCTPTGSGKTTVAELAILYKLFDSQSTSSMEGLDFLIESPIAIYLVPSKALALEVEQKLSKMVSNINVDNISITSLYGGMDWGATEVWFENSNPTVLICTYQKAEALLRFLGPKFLKRVKLVIFDEAHNIQFEEDINKLTYNDRSIVLDSLSARILSYIDKSTSVLALSAVTVGLENTLATWATGEKGSSPVISSYRSTRQLIGRLEYKADGKSEIIYDLLDNNNLRFKEAKSNEGSLYIRDPFPVLPKIDWPEGPALELRPKLYWSAINLAAKDYLGNKSTVLISLASHLNSYAEDFVEFLKLIPKQNTPIFFEEPKEKRKKDLWESCLAVCADYFTKDSVEYKLLKKGIVVHHGKLPAILSKMLIKLIDDRICSVVLATSTLSEGINLPFEVVLIPELKRGMSNMSVREFKNLVGRAGRPGVSTEGRSLVLMGDIYGSRELYFELISLLLDSEKVNTPSSPIIELMKKIYSAWAQLNPNMSFEEFLEWIEKVNPAESEKPDLAQVEINDLVDTLDGIILAATVELEELNKDNLDSLNIEEKLIQVLKRTFAYYTVTKEENLAKVFLSRAKTLRSNLYVEADVRKKLYKTSLPPKLAKGVLNIYPEVRKILNEGADYPIWNETKRFNYLDKIVNKIGSVEPFRYNNFPEKNVTASDVLGWWLRYFWGVKAPSQEKLTDWYGFVSQNFIYKFNWGLGSLTSLALEQTQLIENNEVLITELPQTVYWLKELITWGTLDPFASYLLSHGLILIREEAEKYGELYIKHHLKIKTNVSEIYSISNIKSWIRENLVPSLAEYDEPIPVIKDIKLKRDFSKNMHKKFRVLPQENEEGIYWYDPAGYLLAVSDKTPKWDVNYIANYDFILDPTTEKITFSKY